jgi:hypothetical protein
MSAEKTFAGATHSVSEKNRPLLMVGITADVGRGVDGEKKLAAASIGLSLRDRGNLRAVNAAK